MITHWIVHLLSYSFFVVNALGEHYVLLNLRFRAQILDFVSCWNTILLYLHRFTLVVYLFTLER